jgi:hypothetical protein
MAADACTQVHINEDKTQRLQRAFRRRELLSELGSTGKRISVHALERTH